MIRELASQARGQKTSNVAHRARVKRVRLRPEQWDDEPGVERQPLRGQVGRADEERRGPSLFLIESECLERPPESAVDRPAERSRPHRRVLRPGAAPLISKIEVHRHICLLYTSPSPRD